MRSAGTSRGERQLFGVQTTGRTYRLLSEPQFEIASDLNVAAPMRDGIQLMADVHRPRSDGKYPALLAISPYPRQFQHMSLPLGFIEAGQTDFFVPRGYVHVLANCRGTGGSGGTYEFMGPREKDDLYDLIEWIAAQPWCDGQVGMIGVSYFAMQQFKAALARPPHLKAIFPFSGTIDPYRQFAWHGGIPSSRFAGRYFHAIGSMNRKPDSFFRSRWFGLLNKFLQIPFIHKKLARAKRDPVGMLNRAMIFAYDQHPWDDLYQNVMVEHQLYDDYWRDRDIVERMSEINIPVFLGGDWSNVAVHLHTPFLALPHLAPGTPYRVAMTPRGSLQWPWESMHIEALAWYDHWLKGRDTGIMDGSPIRYFVEGADEWRSTDTWPLPQTRFTDLHLRGDGRLMTDEGTAGARDYLHLPAALDLPKSTHAPALPPTLHWDTEPMSDPVELIGPLVLRLQAASTATDVDWILKLQDIAADGAATDLTQGWLRASHRALDPSRTREHQPYHPHDRVEPLVAGEPTWFDIALLPTAHCFRRGHRLRLLLTSRDTDGFAMQGMQHEESNLPARNRIFTSSRLVVPLTAGAFHL